MTWMAVQINGNPDLYRMSDSDYIVKDGLLYGFTTKWPDGSINHWVYNREQRKVSAFRRELEDLVDKIPAPVREGAAKLAPVAGGLGGLRWLGPWGAAAGVAGGFAVPRLYKLWKEKHPDEIIPAGYYDRDTHERFGDLTAPLRLTDVVFRREIAA